MIDKEKINKEAKELLDKFSKALDKVKTDDLDSEVLKKTSNSKTSKNSNEVLDFHVHRKDFERSEGKGKICEGFKESLLENAPKKNEDFVIAEKGDWKNG